MESKTDEDCYFYYYSTCLKGDACKFRHEPSAKGSETMCPLWLQDHCDKEHCNFRHSYIQKNRKEIPCYWENRPGGCKKPHCPYRHQCPRAAVEGEVELDNECGESATNSANTEIPERKLDKLTSESVTPPSTELDTNLSDECQLVNVKKTTPELQFWVEQKVQNIDSGNERKISILEDDIQVKIQSTTTQASNITTLNDVFTKQHSEFENRMKGNAENSESSKISGDDDLQKISNIIEKCSTKFRRERSSASAPETTNRSLLHYDENDIKEDGKCLLDEDVKMARESQVTVSEAKAGTHKNVQLETSGPSDMDYLDVSEEQEPLPSKRMRTIELDSSQDEDTLDMVRISVQNVDGKENNKNTTDEETEEFVKPRRIKSVIGRPVINSKVDEMKYNNNNNENNARCDFSSVRDCRESINSRRRGVAPPRIKNKLSEKRTEDRDCHTSCPNKSDNKEQKQHNTKFQIGVRNTKRSEKDCDTHLESKTLNPKTDVNSQSSEKSTEIVNNIDAVRKSEKLADANECNSQPSENFKDIDLSLKVCIDLRKVSSKKRLLSQVVPANTRSSKPTGARSDSPNSDTDDGTMSTKLDTAPTIETTCVKNRGENELSSKIRRINQSNIEDCSSPKPKRLKLKRESIYQHFSNLSTKSTNQEQLKEADTSLRDGCLPTIKSSKMLSGNNTSDEDSVDSSGDHCTEMSVQLHGHITKTTSTSTLTKEGTASEEERDRMKNSTQTKTKTLDATIVAEDPHQPRKMPSLSENPNRIASSQSQLPTSLDIESFTQNISGGHSKSNMDEKGLLMDYEDSTVTLDVDEDIIRDIDAFLEDN